MGKKFELTAEEADSINKIILDYREGATASQKEYLTFLMDTSHLVADCLSLSEIEAMPAIAAQGKIAELVISFHKRREASETDAKS